MAEQSLALLPTDINALKRRRGVTRASVTRLTTRLRDLESKKDEPDTPTRVQQLVSKLDAIDAEFKVIHLQIVDLLDRDEDLEAEQDIFDDHEDKVTSLSLRLQQLIHTPTAPAAVSVEKTLLSKKLHHLEKCITTTRTGIVSLPDESDDSALFLQYEAQLADYKSQLTPLREELLLTDDVLEDDPLLALHADLERQLFDCSHLIRRHLTRHTVDPVSSTPVVSTGVKLPKLDVPVFDGNILNWTRFWEQFRVSVHDRTGISNSEKLVYLQHALKDGSAKTVIEGLTRSGEHYVEAVDCLKARFDRPRLVHQTHVKCIVEAPSLKEGNGKELRKLHDTVQQHIRALKSMGHEPSASFITSLIELKLDATTMFEWQRHSQSETGVPHYSKLLEFIDYRAQASESLGTNSYKRSNKDDKKLPKHIPSFPSSTSPVCIACKVDRHPLYICQKFKGLSHDQKVSLLKTNNICLNCLASGHHLKNCKSVHRCRRCQGLHHTLLHFDNGRGSHPPNPVTSNSAVKLDSSCLLMTCRVIFISPNGASIEARCLLDNASSASFISERVAQALRLPRSYQSVSVSGIEGLSSCVTNRAVSQFTVSPVGNPDRRIGVTAVIVPKVTADLPVKPIPFGLDWDHLSDISLSDPAFGEPGRIDALLGIDVFIACLLEGRLTGPPGSPTAFETVFGWVLGGLINSNNVNTQITSHMSTSCLNETIRKFWEIEEPPSDKLACSLEERDVIQHFQNKHFRRPDGKFVVPLPRRENFDSIGESRSQAVRRFLALEHSLNSKGRFSEVDKVILEYLDLGHAEEVPVEDFSKPVNKVFYLPMHVVYKNSSTTTKIRAVFDASAKSASGVSLNDTLLVGPTVHPPLLDVLIRFRFFRIPLVTDVSKMYRAVELESNDKDFHRFVWRSKQNDVIKDYRMTRLTFGVSASCFAANMSVKQNSIDHVNKFPLAAKMVRESFYVDDGLIGADSVGEAIELRREMQELFSCGGFLLRKWNSTSEQVLSSIEPHLRDTQEVHSISDPTSEYTKTLGLEWSIKTDCFRLTISKSLSNLNLTKRTLVSNIAKIFDALGWFSPAIIKVKILLQRLWELNIDWDELAPPSISETWLKWESELIHLTSFRIPRYYFSNISQFESLQLHGFSDASEDAYAAVVYIRAQGRDGNVVVSLVIAKSRVSPIKRMSIPRLELCGAQLLSQLLHYTKGIFGLTLSDIYAWTDSTIVLNWLQGSSRRFKVFVGNRVSSILDRISADRWGHVQGTDNPADAPSRGLFPMELVSHDLWWNGPPWLKENESKWPHEHIANIELPEEERVLSHVVHLKLLPPIIPVNKYSSFHKLLRITSWIHRFIRNCRGKHIIKSPHVQVMELRTAKQYWIHFSQNNCFNSEINLLLSNHDLPNGSTIISLHPFMDNCNILRVGGRLANSKLSFSQKYPIILHHKDLIVRLIIHTEHIVLLHAGPTLLMTSLSRDYHIIGLRGAARSVTRQCVICRRQSAKAEHQLMGQFPQERINPGLIFENVGLDYAGPISIKYGYVRRPTVVKAYIAVFISLSVRAVHLELVSDLTSEAFIACLRRFVARRGCPNQIWSDHGTNFVGANREIGEFYEFLSNNIVQYNISQFCSNKSIEWRFIPERAPNFGGLWEAAVKSMKTHLRKVTTNVKLTYEEMSTVLTQIEACLNSRPLTSIPSSNNDGIEVLTPGHFLIGRPLMSIPDPPSSYNQSITLLRRWQLCQVIVRHFWSRWSTEYLIHLNRFNKWKRPTRNVRIGDVVLIREENVVPTNWPLARVTNVHVGNDGHIRVVDVKTSKGQYRRPITKIVLLLPVEDN